MNPIKKLKAILDAKWRPARGSRVPTASEVAAAAYDPDTKTIRGKVV